MKQLSYYILLIFLFCSNACTSSESISQGEWKYKLYVNGIDVGTATISNKTSDGNFITSQEYSLKFGDMTTVTKDTITETLDFKPVKLENYTKILNSGKVHETRMISVFKGRDVELTYDNKKYNYTLKRDFIIDGNYFMTQLLKNKFKPGLEATHYVYNPQVELDTPIKARTKVIGSEKIMINGKENQFIHIVQSIENIKDNIDLYIDEKGILQKGIIHMLNLKIELIKI
ncbi:MAG: hypothetical protein V1874_03335 [Spirochaetota bacterium]